MNLIRDVLDKQLVDKQEGKLGRVDGIIVEIENGKQPEITSIELGFVTQCYRIHARLGRWVERWERPWVVREPRYRIAWHKITPGHNDVKADVNPKSFSALAFERWLRKQVIERIPGA